ncbi:hypothetical protein [Peptostreptococcus faecalis]|uniref:hypothetical protein n=1 Tax=Peptostreptococcus faecalis TaxID=2045015 RepID=UPI000C7E3376|nr:hypothetical protein [Peptostreptococcus faecalis]
MKNKKNGYLTIELIVAMSIIGLIFILSFPRYNDKEIVFSSEVYRFKSDIRKLNMLVSDREDFYEVFLEDDKYTIFKNDKAITTENLPDNIKILSGESSIVFNNTGRKGAPNKGLSVYFFQRETKRLERITIMLASARVVSYREDYEKNKALVDYLLKDKGEELS